MLLLLLRIYIRTIYYVEKPEVPESFYYFLVQQRPKEISCTCVLSISQPEKQQTLLLSKLLFQELRPQNKTVYKRKKARYHRENNSFILLLKKNACFLKLSRHLQKLQEWIANIDKGVRLSAQPIKYVPVYFLQPRDLFYFKNRVAKEKNNKEREMFFLNKCQDAIWPQKLNFP